MNRDDKLLYHQIHPAKLAVDVATSAVSAWLLWRGPLWLAMLVGWLPSVIVTAAMVRWMDFARQRDSRFGRYVAHHMTRRATAVRLAGQLVMWLAAWFHAAWGGLRGTWAMPGDKVAKGRRDGRSLEVGRATHRATAREGVTHEQED